MVGIDVLGNDDERDILNSTFRKHLGNFTFFRGVQVVRADTTVMTALIAMAAIEIGLRMTPVRCC
jgi:hypothetical protein